jgi:glycosyltransferase involved in cell wall biosynthesis
MTKPKVHAWINDWGRPGCEGKYGGIGWYRIINPLEKIGADVERGEYGIGKAEAAFKMKERGDIWVCKQMGNLEAVMLALTGAKFTGAKLVLDLDDDPFSVDPNHPQYQYHKNHEEMVKMQIEQADHLIVTTEPLRQVCQELNPKITIIPNAIDRKIWKFKKKKRNDGRIRLGWVGSASHLADREVIEDAIHQIMKKYPQVDFYHAGMAVVDGQDNREFSFKGTKGYEEYPAFLNSLDLDIAIAPIKDTQFNRCKSNIKWLEHSMLKTPMVLSDVYPYSTSITHGKDGYLAKGTAQWVKYLSWLIENPEKRKEIAENAYKKVNKEWIIENYLPKYQELFQKLMPKNITVYTSIIGDYDKLSEKEIQDANMVAFTDQKSEVWETQKIYDKFTDNTRNSRIQKIMPHLFFDSEYSIYLDGNIELLVPAQKLIDEFLKDKDIAVFKHCGRDDIYQEAVAIAGYKKDTVQNVTEQVKAYAKRGIKEHSGLCECGVIIRRHTPRINDLNEKWWAEYCRFSRRDQMSFPIAFPLEEVNQINSSVYKHPYFKYKNHK